MPVESYGASDPVKGDSLRLVFVEPCYAYREAWLPGRKAGAWLQHSKGGPKST